jgi:hypothetical protein
MARSGECAGKRARLDVSTDDYFAIRITSQIRDGLAAREKEWQRILELRRKLDDVLLNRLGVVKSVLPSVPELAEAGA